MVYKVALLWVVISGFFLAGDFYGRNQAKGAAATMRPGTYEAYSVQKRFDTQTGQPVYWVIGSAMQNEQVSVDGKTITAPVITGTPKFYKVSRERITNLPADTIADPTFNYTGTISVR